MCSTSFVSMYWSWNTHMCQVVCNPGMNFMKVHAFLLKGWFSSLNTNVLCVSWCQIERAARLRLRLGNLLHLHAIRDSKIWNDSDKTSMTARNYKTSFIIPWWQVSFFFSWQAALLEEPWLHFHLTLIPLLISPKPLTI